jgi:hypothetical protein
MPNQNPIFINEGETFTDFNIPQQQLAEEIRMTIKIELLDEGWRFDSDHIVAIQDNPDNLYNGEPPPEDLLIGRGSDITDKRFRSFSRIRLFRDGAENENASRVKYTITFFAGGQQLDEFSKESDHTNPVDFITAIQFTSI